MTEDKVSHAWLVRAAAHWLRQHECVVVVTELATSAIETPDALGWQSINARTIMVECKISLSDFKADTKKRIRIIGDQRFYMTTPELASIVVEKNLLPDGWGLITVEAHRGRFWHYNAIRESILHRDVDCRQETLILLSIVQRRNIKLSVRYYKFPYRFPRRKRRATIGVQEIIPGMDEANLADNENV